MTKPSKHTKTNDHFQPDEIVGKYYQALYRGDLQSVKALMTEESYYMTLEPFGFKLSFDDPLFTAAWEQMEKDKEALHEVERKISAELLSRKLSPHIKIKETEANGPYRSIVYYEKDGKKKKLAFSKEAGDWHINYFAGRPVSPSFFSLIKEKMISLLPTFKV